MAKNTKFSNPFYVALIIVSVVFALTTMSYGVLIVKNLRIPTSSTSTFDEEEPQQHPLLTTLDQYGLAILMTELGVLAVLTVACIGTDEYWEKQARDQQSDGDAAEKNEENEDS